MVVIKSKNFILRPFKKGDGIYLVKYANDRLVSKYVSTMPYPYTSKDANKWLKHCIVSNKKKSDTNFVIEIDGNFVGSIGLWHIKKHKAEIGYWLGRKYWNQGIMTEAVKLITNFGFKKLKLKRIYAYIFTKNKASARVLEKSGYKREGLLRKHYFKDRKFSDAFLYAKIK